MASDNGECRGAVGAIDINQELDFSQGQNESALLNDLIDVNDLKLDDEDEGNW